MNFMLSTDAVVCCALAESFIFLLSTSARPAPYTMYTPPVPPVTMLSVLPSKFGVGDAAAVPGTVAVGADWRGAAQAAATSNSATSGASAGSGRLISQPPSGRSLGGAGPFQPERAPVLRRLHAASFVVRLSEQGRKRHRPT